MRIRRSALWALVGILILSFPAALSAQVATHKVEDLQVGVGEVEPHADGYRHRASGYIFPRKLDVVPARKSTIYGDRDADVYYTLYGGGNGDGWINLYVYPANITLDEEVSNVTSSLIEKSSGQRISTPMEMGRPSMGVKEAWFKGSVQGTDLITGYRVARIGNWFLKARISIPAKADQAVFGRIGAALNAIDFQPAKLAPANPMFAKEPVN